ncbi:MAG TPA: PQQ-binding-like beta-propeller repeat protein [Candidatus Sulfotelmatobacter sp.]|nr:PQQ-binding-like beta-propeller repeat protein [Candidatus Sulfotelmatobacter sp.]
MKKSNKMTKTTSILAIILMMASITLITVTVQPVQAQLAAKQPHSGPLQTGDVANGTFDSQTWISARPKVVGIGQSVLINVWTTPAANAGRKLLGYHIIITKPDGTKDEYTLNSERDTAATWMEYVPNQIGEYKYKVEFPGTFLPAGIYNDGVIYTNTSAAGSGYQGVPTIYSGSTYYKPDTSPEYTFSAQQDMIWSWGATALPTDYWTRPVAPELRDWLPIIGDFPWYGPPTADFYQMYPNDGYWSPRSDFYPFVRGPNTAHIAWKRVGNIAGITGAGRYGSYGAEGWSYEVPFATTSGSPGVITMVIDGRGFLTVPRVRSQMINGTLQQVSTTALQSVDIRTGEVLWEVDGFTHPQSLDSFGSWIFGGAIEYPSLSIVYLDGGRLYKYNSNTGALTLNVSISPLTSATWQMNGYALSVQNLGNNVSASQRYRLINFTTIGSSTNFTSRIVSNISWPLSSVPATTDYTLGIAASFGRGLIAQTGTTPEQRLVTVDLRTGQVLVNKTIEPAGGERLMGYSGASDVVDHGTYAFLTAWGEFIGLDIRTGEVKWTSPKMDEQWDVNGFGAYDTTSAYGMFYRAAYTGVYAFDWNTGKIVWKYEAPAISPFETPYIDKNGTTVMSFNGVAFAADGKIYTINTEHTPTQPITRGWQLHAINATTGEEVFKVKLTGNLGAIADGYMAISESYTGTLYVLGKGKSQTTVTAPDIGVPLGTSVVLKGTVVDLSPAQSGTPAVSKESMSTQMEYLHKQLPIDGIWHNETITGVPVSLTAIGSDGSVVDIGSVTTNGYYGTFSKTWTPPKQGDYEIVASFAGDDSYGSSAASTSISIGPAPTTPNTGSQQQEIVVPDYTMTIIGVGIAVILAVAIATILLYRKK